MNPNETRFDLRYYAVEDFLPTVILSEDISWDNSTKSKLIESILIRMPLPLFYVDSMHNIGYRKVIDGIKRAVTLKQYLSDSFRLSDLDFYPQFTGLKFSQLKGNYQRRIQETQ